MLTVLPHDTGLDLERSFRMDASASKWPAILFFTVVAAVLPGIALAQEKGGCQRKTISLLVSPDDLWVALVQEDTCSDGYFVTTITDNVQLARRDNADDMVQIDSHPDKPKHENDVFTLEGGHPERRPLTRWLSPTKLQINVPNNSLIGLQKSSYKGIDILVKFEPDDPVERERWLKSLGLPTR